MPGTHARSIVVALSALALFLSSHAPEAHAQPDPRPYVEDDESETRTHAQAEPAAQEAATARTRPRPRRWKHTPLVETLDSDDAATRAAGRVLTRLARIRESVRQTWYRHKTKVSQRKGIYAWDCSGMTSWILEKEAPRAREALRRDRPVAITYLDTIQKAPTDKARRGWQRIADIRDVRPGDVFAWRRPKEWGKGATGHVGFVVSRPQPLDDVDNAYVIRIVDSTRYRHGDDTRESGETGFGFGTLLFVTDEAGSPTAYGWFGAESQGVVPTDVAFGRVSR